MRQLLNNRAHAVYADAGISPGVVDLHDAMRSRSVIAGTAHLEIADTTMSNRLGAQTLDFSTWLPFAAKEYVLSSNIDDYFLTPVLTIPTELPNRNCVGFPLNELMKFNVEAGRLAYRTFIGKPVHIEHDNEDPTKAIGVIVDAMLKPTAGYGAGKMWRLFKLLAIDRTKNPTVAQKILSRQINTYSMGAWVKSFTCSYCGAEIGNCRHLNPGRKFDFYELTGHLVYRLCKDVNGFETSSVEDPAYSVAASDIILPW